MTSTCIVTQTGVIFEPTIYVRLLRGYISTNMICLKIIEVMLQSISLFQGVMKQMHQGCFVTPTLAFVDRWNGTKLTLRFLK